MSTFGRALSDEAMEVAGKLVSEKTSWLPELLANWAPSGSTGTLRIAIRNGYMNFYAKGQSIAKITYNRRDRKLALHVHKKYVIDSPRDEKGYIIFDMKGNYTGDNKVKYNGLQTLDAWINRSSKYTNEEKRNIDTLVDETPTIIDLEMGLPAYDGGNNSLRIDIVSLEGSADDLRLTFSEAKMISDSRLRSSIQQPKVLGQINRYRAYLNNHERRLRIVEAYRQTCRIIRNFHIMASGLTALPHLDPLILAAAEPNSPLGIDDTLRLIVFDNGNPRREKAWQKHLGVLRHNLSVNVLRRGVNGFEVV